MANEKIVCAKCGSDFNENTWIKSKDFDGYYCPFCDTLKMTASFNTNMEDYEFESRLEKVVRHLQKLEYRQAESILEDYHDDPKYGNDARVYFYTALAKYKICFIQSEDNHFVPTLNDLPDNSIRENYYAKKALELASKNIDSHTQKSEEEYFQEVFDTIDTFSNTIKELSKDEEAKYDVFISVKVSKKKEDQREGESTFTNDKDIADKVYSRLRKRFDEAGFKKNKIFYSEKAKEEGKLNKGSSYEPVIYAALHSAKIFILIGTDVDNINAPWVKNEWTRYLYLTISNPSQKSFFLYTNLANEELPSSLKKVNSYAAGTYTGSNFDIGANFIDSIIEQMKTFERATKFKDNVEFDFDIQKKAKRTIDLLSPSENTFLKIQQSSTASVEEQNEAILCIAEIKTAKDDEKVEYAYQKLEKIVAEDPNAINAKIQLLFRNTPFRKSGRKGFESEPDNYLNYPDLLNEMFKCLTEKEAQNILSDLLQKLISNTLSTEKEVKMFQGVLSHYLSHLNQDSLEMYLKHIESMLYKEDCPDLEKLTQLVQVKDNEDMRCLLDNYFDLVNYQNKNLSDEARIKDYLDKVESIYPIISSTPYGNKLVQKYLDFNFLNEEFLLKKISLDLFHEDLDVDTMIKKYASYYGTKDAEPVKTYTDLVGNNDLIQAFLTCVKLKESRGSKKKNPEGATTNSVIQEGRKVLRLFLYVLISQDKSFQEIVKPDDITLEENDFTYTDGFSLFSQYIFNTLDEADPRFTTSQFIPNDNLTPTPEVIRVREKQYRDVRDQILMIYAVKLHQKGHYEKAKKVYDWELTAMKQKMPEIYNQSLDYAYIFHYQMLASCHALKLEDLDHCDTKYLDNLTRNNFAVFIANSDYLPKTKFGQKEITEEDIQKVFSKIEVHADKQKTFIDNFIPFRKILDEFEHDVPLDVGIKILKEYQEELNNEKYKDKKSIYKYFKPDLIAIGKNLASKMTFDNYRNKAIYEDQIKAIKGIAFNEEDSETTDSLIQQLQSVSNADKFFQIILKVNPDSKKNSLIVPDNFFANLDSNIQHIPTYGGPDQKELRDKLKILLEELKEKNDKTTITKTHGKRKIKMIITSITSALLFAFLLFMVVNMTFPTFLGGPLLELDPTLQLSFAIISVALTPVSLFLLHVYSNGKLSSFLVTFLLILAGICAIYIFFLYEITTPSIFNYAFLVYGIGTALLPLSFLKNK